MQVTCFIPNYNGAPFLAKILESLEGQSYKDFVVLLADDGSTDDSLKIAEGFLSRLPLEILPFPNGGIAQAWNRAFAQVKTPYFTLTHCDDELEPDYFAEMVALMDAFPQAALGHCPAKAIDARSRVFNSPQEAFKKKRFFQPGQYTRPLKEEYRLLQGGNYFCCPSVIYRTQLVQQVGYFNANLGLALDWEYWFRALLAGYSIAATDQVLFRYRRHGENASVKAGNDCSRFYEEHDLLVWAHQEGQNKGWVKEDEAVDLRLLAQTLLPEIALDLKTGNRAAADQKIKLLGQWLPAYSQGAPALALQGLCRLGKAGGSLLDLSIRGAVKLLSFF